MRAHCKNPSVVSNCTRPHATSETTFPTRTRRNNRVKTSSRRTLIFSPFRTLLSSTMISNSKHQTACLLEQQRAVSRLRCCTFLEKVVGFCSTFLRANIAGAIADKLTNFDFTSINDVELYRILKLLTVKTGNVTCRVS